MGGAARMADSSSPSLQTDIFHGRGRFGFIDGPLAPIGCVSHTAYSKCSCPDEEHCGLRLLMLDVRNAIANISIATRSLKSPKSHWKTRQDGLPLPFSISNLLAEADSQI
jgi:hypothetical protein